MTLKISCIFLLVLSSYRPFAQNSKATANASLPVTAIMGAMELEVNLLKQQLQNKHDTLIQHIPFFTGTIGGKAVVITRSGVGKVNAAIITTLLIDHFKPAYILFSGIAGGLNPNMHPGDVVIAERIAHHDYGRKWPDSLETWATRSPVDFVPNPLFFICDTGLVSLAKKAGLLLQLQQINHHVPTVQTGTILTGDVFLSDGNYGKALRAKTGADAVEMEGAAVAQTAYQQKVPFLIIRSLSDSANDDAALDFNLYGKIAAENSAALIAGILRLIK